MRMKKSRAIVPFAGVIVGLVALACSSASDDRSTPIPSQGAPPAAAAPADTSTPVSTPQPAPTPDAAPASEQPAASQLAASTPSSGTGGFNWDISDVDTGAKPSLALDSNGTPYVAYMLEDQRGFVKNAVLSGSSWDITTVKDGYFYGPLDIAIGPDDVPRIVYHDHQDSSFKPNKGDAVVASLVNGSWDNDSIFDEGHDGWDTRIFISPDGDVHISAIDPEEFEGDGVEYYHQDSSGKWTVEDIPSGQLTYKYATSVAVSSDGTPYVTYFDQSGSGDGKLVLADKSGGGWNLERVDTDGDTGLFSSLVIDDSGRFHISYFERESGTSGIVKYATKGPDEAEWEFFQIDSLDSLVFGFVGARNITSVAVDSNGNPWVAYTDEDVVKLAVWDGSDWQVDSVVEAGSATLGQLVVLKIDSNDEPHLTWFDVSSRSPIVKYAKGTPK